MNSVTLVGRLTKDPELKTLQTGSVLLNFCVAVDRGDKDRNTDFINCQAWGKTAEFICQYFHKGDPIGINGRIQSRSYEKDGKKVSVIEVLTDKVSFIPSRTSVASQNTANYAEESSDISF